MLLLKGDCLVEMDKIPDGSVDLILCDPPYGTTACKWDSVIPFEPMWEQLNRIIKANGAIVLFGSEPFSSYLRISNIKNYKYDWVWIKNRSADGVMAKNKPLIRNENVIVFSFATYGTESKNRMEYYPQDIVEINKKVSGKNVLSKNFVPNRTLKKKKFIQTHTNYPKNILEYKKDGKDHPTQKPVALMEYLIKTYTNETETVLDFTMGSGSTGVACVNTNRKFIGIEMDDKYFNIAVKRINDAQEQMTLRFI